MKLPQESSINECSHIFGLPCIVRQFIAQIFFRFIIILII